MKISLITVTFNSSETLRDTIQSVLLQSYPNVEYIIVDGHSQDTTIEIIKKYEPLFQGRLKWISEKDSGLYDAMNKGIRMATGDIVGIINSDDFYVNNTEIARIISGFDNSFVDAIYTNLYLVDPMNLNKIVRDCQYCDYNSELFFRGWHPPHPSFFVRKKIYDECGCFDLNYKISADYDFMFRILVVYGKKALYMPFYTIKMRNGGASTNSIKAVIRTQKECLRVFEKYGLHVNYVSYFVGKYIQKLKQYTLTSFFNDLKSKINI